MRALIAKKCALIAKDVSSETRQNLSRVNNVGHMCDRTVVLFADISPSLLLYLLVFLFRCSA